MVPALVPSEVSGVYSPVLAETAGAIGFCFHAKAEVVGADVALPDSGPTFVHPRPGRFNKSGLSVDTNGVRRANKAQPPTSLKSARPFAEDLDREDLSGTRR